jgi:hypothetical protein
MRIDVRPRKRNSPRIAEKSAPGFLQWLRGRECLAFYDGEDCDGKIQAAHVDYAGGKGMGTKVADRYAVPLCAGHHARQHAIGWFYFQTEICRPQDYALKAAEQYWSKWPGRIAWERKLEGGQ